jgi:hypothetical protein
VVGHACFTFDRAGYENAVNGVRMASINPKSAKQAGVLPEIVRETSHDWNFIEVEKGSRTKAKPGVAAEVPGATLELRLRIHGIPGPVVVLQVRS